MGKYIRKDAECDHCGEPVFADASIGLTWSDGSKVHPLNSKSRGVQCAHCRWTDFDDFCRSQGCSARNPVLHIA